MGVTASESLTIRGARPVESGLLSELAVRSKGHWGYSPEFLASCRDELVVDPSRLRDGDYRYYVADRDDTVVGFYAVQIVSDEICELEALFVEPKHIGSGVGRALIEHAKSTASGLGAARLIVQGDPNADRFYRAAGGRQVGERESDSIPGRLLPLFEIDL